MEARIVPDFSHLILACKKLDLKSWKPVLQNSTSLLGSMYQKFWEDKTLYRNFLEII